MEDDFTIGNDCELLRRIHPIFIVFDENTRKLRISSGAFNDAQMSVHIGDCVKLHNATHTDILKKYPNFGLAGLSAQFMRSKNQICYREDVQDEICHGVVAGKKTGATKNAFAREAMKQWHVQGRPKDS